MSMCVLDAESDKNGIWRVFRLEYVFDLSFDLEEVVLTQVDFSKLKLNGFLDDSFQVLVHFQVLSVLLLVVFDVHTGLDHLQPDLWLIL